VRKPQRAGSFKMPRGDERPPALSDAEAAPWRGGLLLRESRAGCCPRGQALGTRATIVMQRALWPRKSRPRRLTARSGHRRGHGSNARHRGREIAPEERRSGHPPSMMSGSSPALAQSGRDCRGVPEVAANRRPAGGRRIAAGIALAAIHLKRKWKVRRRAAGRQRREQSFHAGRIINIEPTEDDRGCARTLSIGSAQTFRSSESASATWSA